MSIFILCVCVCVCYAHPFNGFFFSDFLLFKMVSLLFLDRLHLHQVSLKLTENDMLFLSLHCFNGQNHTRKWILRIRSAFYYRNYTNSIWFMNKCKMTFLCDTRESILPQLNLIKFKTITRLISGYDYICVKCSKKRGRLL